MKENRVRKTFIQLFTLAVLMFVTYYLIMREQDFRQVMTVLEKSSKIWLISALAVMGVYIFCGGYAIKVLVRPLGHRVSIWGCFKYSFVENYFSAITPSNTGGQPMQLVYMGRDGIKGSDSSVVLIAVTVLYKAAFLCLTVLLFALTAGYIDKPILSIWPLALLGFVCNVGLISLLLIVLFYRRLSDWLIRSALKLLAKLHLIKNIDEKLVEYEAKLDNYHECARFFLSHRKIVLRAFVVVLVQRLALLSVPLLVYRSFGLTEFSAVQILATQCLLNLCVDLMPLPGAVGISETVFLMLFTPIFGERDITTAVMLSRGISFYLMVIVSAMVVMGLQVSQIVRSNKSEENRPQ